TGERNADAATEAGADPAAYNDVTDGANWTAFDLVGSAGLPQNGLFGATFDGRYVYFGCANGGPTTRYDTQSSFTAAGAWSTHTTPPDLEGAVFDGRYVYLVPSLAPTAIRFDTHGMFADGSSWNAFTTTAVHPNAKSFSGAVFDGRYVYYSPDNA